MNLNFSKEELDFQQEVRQFLAANLPQHIIDATANNGSVFVEKDTALEWQEILVDKRMENQLVVVEIHMS